MNNLRIMFGGILLIGLLSCSAAATLFAYVPNLGDNTVSVINTTDNTVAASTVTVGASPYGVAVSPDGSRVYVGNSGGVNTVSVIDTGTNTVIATVGVAALQA